MVMQKYCQFCRYCGQWLCTLNRPCNFGEGFEPSITSERFSETMIAIKNTHEHDPEVCHAKMDEFMGETLMMMGYEHGYKVFQDTKKYYGRKGEQYERRFNY